MAERLWHPGSRALLAAEMANRSAYDQSLQLGAPEASTYTPEPLPDTAAWHLGEVAGAGVVEAPGLSPAPSTEDHGAHEGGISLRGLIDATDRSAGYPPRGAHAALTVPSDRREGGLSMDEVHARLGGRTRPAEDKPLQAE